MSLFSKFKFFTNLLTKGVVVITLFIVVRKLVPELIEPATIVIIQPVDGPASIIASHNTQGFMAAIDELNEEGYFGFFNNLRQIRPIVINDSFKDLNAVDNLKKKLLEEDVEAVFGCADSACVRLIQPLIDELDLPFFYVQPHEGLLESKNSFFLVIT